LPADDHFDHSAKFSEAEASRWLADVEGLLDILVDPIDRRPLTLSGSKLIAQNGAVYPVIDGIPVLLHADPTPTVRGTLYSLMLADLALHGGAVDMLTALGRPDHVKAQIRREIDAGSDPADAVIRRLIRATNGPGYRDLSAGERPPVPAFPLQGDGERLIDIGCSWGRWTVAAARAGFHPLGVDPQLGPLLAAKRFAAKNRRNVQFVCADARRLPFKDGAFRHAFSYSTLQHFRDADFSRALQEIARVLSASGTSTIQMANRAGLRSLWHQARRGFRAPTGFEVRYRAVARMLAAFRQAIGPTTISIDCFFGLGLQTSDIAFLRPTARLATRLSECLKAIDRNYVSLLWLADSLWFHSTAKTLAN